MLSYHGGWYLLRIETLWLLLVNRGLGLSHRRDGLLGRCLLLLEALLG